jgi:hypothetical protein
VSDSKLHGGFHEAFVAPVPCTISPPSSRRKVFGNERALVVYSWHEDDNPSVIAHGEEQRRCTHICR